MPTRALSTAGEDAVLDALARQGEHAWRARQIQAAIWQPFVGDFDELLQLPARLRRALAAEFAFSTVSIASELLADGGETIKLLCRLGDGQTIETVAMETPARATLGAGRPSASAARWAARWDARSARPATWGCGATAPRRRSSTRYAPPAGLCTVGEWGP